MSLATDSHLSWHQPDDNLTYSGTTLRFHPLALGDPRIQVLVNHLGEPPEKRKVQATPGTDAKLQCASV